MRPGSFKKIKMPKVFRSQLIEQIIPTGSTSTKIQFNDQPYLRNRQIFGVEAINSSDMTLSPTNNVPLTDAQFQTAYLTLYLNDVGDPNAVGEWIQQVPFTLLHRVQNAVPSPFVRNGYELAGQVVYWEKCYVTFPVALGNGAPASILLNVYFK
jgi:hypothetical protein